MESKRSLMDIIDYLEVAYILSDQQNILFKNKQVNQLIEIVQFNMEEKQFLLEEDDNHFIETENLLEEFYKKANSFEYFNSNIKKEIVDHFIKDEELQNSKVDISEEVKENINSIDNMFSESNFLKYKKTNLLNTLTLKIDDQEDESKLQNDIKRKKKSLFKKQTLRNKKKNNKLSQIHQFLLKYKNDFKSFIAILSIPLSNDKETKIFQLSLRIASHLSENQNYMFEYIIKDISKEKEAEALKNEIRCKSLFLAKIAHEFKNPIITINSVCQTLNSRISQLMNMNNSYQSSDYDSEEEAKLNNILTKRKSSLVNHVSLQENINFIITTGNYLMSLIYDLNYFTRIEINNFNRLSKNEVIEEHNAMKDSEFDLIPTLEFCLKIFRERQKNDENKKNVTILSEYDRKLPEKIFSNEMKIKQILVNLLSNAYKFTIVGKITLSAKLYEKNKIRFEVSDTGTGIPEDKFNNIWNPFSFNEKNQSMNAYGSGLGLFIVKDLCKQLNSDVDFYSSEGEGSIFWFDLKISQGEASNYNISTKTVLQKPLMNESLKKLYQYNFSNSCQYSSERTDKEVKCKSFENFRNSFFENSQKFESCLNLMKFKELLDLKANVLGTDPQKRFTLKNFYYKKLSNKNVINSESDIAESFYQDSSDFSSPPSIRMRINNISRKHILETKFSPFNSDIRQIKGSPAQTLLSRGYDNKRRLNEIIEGVEENDTRNPIRIIVCDDDRAMRGSIVRQILKVAEDKKITVDVKESINGIECLNAIYQAFLSGNNYDAVLIDEAMPFMKGSKCMSILRDMYKDGFMNKIKKISISSFEDQETIKYIKTQGCDEFLPKPHNKEVISKFLESLLS